MQELLVAIALLILGWFVVAFLVAIILSRSIHAIKRLEKESINARRDF